MYAGATFSSNTYFTQLEKQVGVCNVVKAAEALGLKRADGANLQTGILPNGKLINQVNAGEFVDGEKPTFTLGNTAVTPLSLASSYATLAARGMRCDPIILKSITDNKNRQYAVPSANCQQAIPQDVADRVADILHGPFSGDGTARKAMISGYLVSGKTGTQTDAPTILTNGFTPDIAGSAIITSDPKHPEAIKNIRSGQVLPQLAGLRVHGAHIVISSGGGSTDYYTVNSKTGYTLSGGSGPEAGGSIWRPTMLKVLPLLPDGVRSAQGLRYRNARTNASIGSMTSYSSGSVRPRRRSRLRPRLRLRLRPRPAGGTGNP